MNSEYQKTDWCCPHCMKLLKARLSTKLTIDIVCDNCGRHFKGIVYIEPPYVKCRRRDSPKYTDKCSLV